MRGSSTLHALRRPYPLALLVLLLVVGTVASSPASPAGGVAAVVPGQMAYATLGDRRVIIQGLAAGSVAPPSRAMNSTTR